MRRRRLTRREKRSRRKKAIIISSLCLLFVMTAGYAAFQTNLSITAKGNIMKKYAAEQLKENVVDTGDGLYKDIYEDGKYIYKGANPNNYITFNNELWRIISVENDNTIKILKDELLSELRVFESAGARTVGYCSNTHGSYGCNAWSSTANMVGSPAEFTNGNYSGSVDADSEMLTYLNGEYLNNLIDTSTIVSHIWDIGAVSYINDDFTNLSVQIKSEKKYQWNGQIGLIKISEYLRSNSDVENCGTIEKNWDNYNNCSSTSWMFLRGNYWWTLAPNCISASSVWPVSPTGSLYDDLEDNVPAGVRPALYLSSDITIISGTGEKNNPYRIQ